MNRWLENVSQIRGQQQGLFDYLLTKHPTDFTFFVQSCEDRVGHWLYPIQPHNTGYNPSIHSLRVDAFPNQYREFDKVLGTILKHVDTDTTLIILSDHGIEPLREIEPHDAHRDHAGTTPVIARHDFEDGDDCPGEPVLTFLRTWLKLRKLKDFQVKFSGIEGHPFENALQSFQLLERS